MVSFIARFQERAGKDILAEIRRPAGSSHPAQFAGFLNRPCGVCVIFFVRLL